ncbi:MAG: DUF4505 family protein [Ignavibacteria bacterium]|nr:DUF4505 family protein [Ignavibacteria bacterium]
MKRDYYYELSDKGELTIDGHVQDDPWFLDFFFRRLAPTADEHYKEFPFVCRCGDEMNYLKPVDAPIVYHRLEDARLMYGSSLTSFFNPNKLAVSNSGVMYHWAPVGEWGRLVANVALEIAQNVEAWGPFLAFVDREAGVRYPILPLWLQDKYTFVRPKRDNACVACGEANPFSMKLTFVFDSETEVMSTYVKPDMRMMGTHGITHGGYVSMLLDETMGKSLSFKGVRAPTANLNVTFRKPMLLGEEYHIKSWIEKTDGRKNFLRGEIVCTSNPEIIVATATALFITVKSS